MNKLKWIIAFITLITGAVVLASTGGGFDLSRYTVANGGQLSSANGYVLNGSIGQPVVASSNGSGYTLISGFWGGYPDVASTPVTPVPDTPTPEPAGVELLLNGSFEIDTAAPLKQPDFWKVTLPSKDKKKCNTPLAPDLAFDGICAYVFKGTPTEAVKMTSNNVDLTVHSFGAQDTLTFSLYYKTGAVAPRLKYKVIVRYIDPALTPGITKGMIETASQGVYTQYPPVTYTLESGNLQVIKVKFMNRALSGKIFIDAVSLIHMDNSVGRQMR
jgi:hypothetical protein